MSTLIKDLGAVSAYAYAVEKGYTGTEDEFASLMYDYTDVIQIASEARDGAVAANASAQEAKAEAQTASNTANEAANKATSKASEASASVTEAGKATNAAVAAKTAAETAQQRAETAQQASEDAQRKAEIAKNEAQENATIANSKASKASQYATTATNKASEASTSAKNAKTYSEQSQASATTANTKADEASASANSARVSADNAQQSATNAQTYMNSSSTSASKAQANAEKTQSDKEAVESAKSDVLSAVDNAQNYANSAQSASQAIQNMDVEATTLEPDSDATVEKTVDATSGVVTLTYGIPKGQVGEKGDKGDTGDSGVYIGTSAPSDENVNVWIDSDGEPDDVIQIDIFRNHVFYQSNSAAVNNGDGTYTIGTSNYGSVVWDNIYLEKGEYELFGVEKGYSFLSPTKEYQDRIVFNETASPKIVTIENEGWYYIGHRQGKKPTEEFVIEPFLKVEKARFAESVNLLEWVDILTQENISDIADSVTVAVDNGDGTITVPANSYGKLITRTPITLKAGNYLLFGTDYGLAFVGTSTDEKDYFVTNKFNSPKPFTLAEETVCYIGLLIRTTARPDIDYTFAPFVKATGYVTKKDIADLRKRIDENEGHVTELSDEMTGAKTIAEIPISNTIGETMYINGFKVITAANTARGHSQIIQAVGTKIRLLIDSTINVDVAYKVENSEWKFIANQSGDTTVEFPINTVKFFMTYKAKSGDVQADRTLVKAWWMEVSPVSLVKEYMLDRYRQQADVLKMQKQGSEGNADCIFKAMLISDVHMQKDRMANVVSLVEEWGASYFDALVNCGDTCNSNTDDTTWYDALTNGLSVPNINTVGNHDWSDAVTTYDKIIAPIALQSAIIQPTGASENGLCYYYTDTANVRIIVLNCMAWTTEQADWLESVLADAITNNKAVIGVSHYGFHKDYATHLECNWCYVNTTVNNSNFTLNIQAAEKMQTFKNNGGTFICWLFGHEHADNLNVLADYGNQLTITVPTLTTRALHLYPNPNPDAYNYDVMTYIAVDDYHKVIKLMRIGGDIDMMGIRHEGVVLSYESGTLVASW